MVVVCLCLTSHRQRGHLERHPHLLSLAKDVKLGKYTVPTVNRTRGRRVAVHYATTASRKLHYVSSKLCRKYCTNRVLNQGPVVYESISVLIHYLLTHSCILDFNSVAYLRNLLLCYCLGSWCRGYNISLCISHDIKIINILILLLILYNL